MLGNKRKRNKVTEERGIQARVNKHIELMQVYISLGMTRTSASRKAYEDIIKEGKPPIYNVKVTKAQAQNIVNVIHENIKDGKLTGHTVDLLHQLIIIGNK